MALSVSENGSFYTGGVAATVTLVALLCATKFTVCTSPFTRLRCPGGLLRDLSSFVGQEESLLRKERTLQLTCV